MKLDKTSILHLLALNSAVRPVDSSFNAGEHTLSLASEILNTKSTKMFLTELDDP